MRQLSSSLPLIVALIAYLQSPEAEKIHHSLEGDHFGARTALSAPVRARTLVAKMLLSFAKKRR